MVESGCNPITVWNKGTSSIIPGKSTTILKEEKRLWEDFRHGLYLGTSEFVENLKTTFLTDSAHAEIPQLANC
jgi:hypothetical protein